MQLGYGTAAVEPGLYVPCGQLAHVFVAVDQPYPGWQPARNSRCACGDHLIGTYQRTYEDTSPHTCALAPVCAYAAASTAKVADRCMVGVHVWWRMGMPCVRMHVVTRGQPAAAASARRDPPKAGVRRQGMEPRAQQVCFLVCHMHLAVRTYMFGMGRPLPPAAGLLPASSPCNMLMSPERGLSLTSACCSALAHAACLRAHQSTRAG